MKISNLSNGLKTMGALGLALSLTVAAVAKDVSAKLSGAQEVPAVVTTASGSAKLSVDDDGTVSGVIKTTGIDGTMAHIHQGKPGINGPVLVKLVKGPDDTWTVPPGTKLTADQLQSFKAGELYVNVHSDAHQGGEIRAQLRP